MAELKEGTKAPAIKLQTDTEEAFDLAAHKGKNVVVYFYPKADTPGCTVEACEFRDNHKKIDKLDTIVVGVSPDAPKALAKFKQKFNLNFPLLADIDHKIAEAYGVWTEKSMYGKKYMGIERTTFVIDKEGKIAKIFRKVKPAGHAEEILEAVGTI
jgi:peroxiredoxin Q/BCP